MQADEFRLLGHALVDRIADFYGSLDARKVTGTLDPVEIRKLLGPDKLPDEGTDPAQLLAESVPLLFHHSLHNGHPKFMGYITSSAAPLGALADLLASALNANLARWELSPVASEIEARAVRWVAEFIGYDPNASGLMVSGGTMANFVGFVAARTAMAPWDIRSSGVYANERRLTAYVSTETHTWIQKAADVCGLGADAIRWIDTDEQGRMRPELLKQLITADRDNGCLPFLVVGTAGSISRGVVDPLRELAVICAEQNLWFHVDGAYGAPAAALDDVPDDLHALSLADSVAIDPHKWLYCPIEVACVVTKHEHALKAAFGFTPQYYRLEGRRAGGMNYYELGMQNTRGFRALKVWLMFRAVGRSGYRDLIREDIRLARRLFELVDRHPDFVAHAVNLSVATFRYVPRDLNGGESKNIDAYLDALNQALLSELQASGELFLSNAVVNGHYLLRACIVNFRTSGDDIESVPGMIAGFGQRLDRELRPNRSV
jgi:glutamate/tyrosine decarboxylase-like PLP-dependent enzyme